MVWSSSELACWFPGLRAALAIPAKAGQVAHAPRRERTPRPPHSHQPGVVMWGFDLLSGHGSISNLILPGAEQWRAIFSVGYGWGVSRMAFNFFRRLAPGSTGFYRVLPGSTGFYRVLPGRGYNFQRPPAPGVFPIGNIWSGIEASPGDRGAESPVCSRSGMRRPPTCAARASNRANRARWPAGPL